MPAGQFCCGDRGEDGPAVGGFSYMWCVMGDWCAYFCVALIYTSLFAIDATITKFCLLPMYKLSTWTGWIHMIFFQSIVFMVVFCHMSAQWTDPGIVAKDATGLYFSLYQKRLEKAIIEEQNGNILAVRRLKKTFCRKCNTPKPEGAHHCSTCNRCIRQMDHHCPWVNNCVAERNLKAFILFLFYVSIGTGYAVIIYLLRVYRLMFYPTYSDKHHGQPKNTVIMVVIGCALAFVMACFFFVFVLCMCYDQYEAMTTGVAGVDAMQIKGNIPRVQSWTKGFVKMVMHNEPFSYRWFLPFPPRTLKRSAPPSDDEVGLVVEPVYQEISAGNKIAEPREPESRQAGTIVNEANNIDFNSGITSFIDSGRAKVE